ncbi:PC-Esterase [Dillenia turbinata]|uniref:PC-Esterase n=1 Tax=Dillenia turbinata TaxID=194707 RepID=A0AAN8WHI2_9MAGN
MASRWKGVTALLFVIHIHLSNAKGGGSCDFFSGNWAYDASYATYNQTTCPFVQKEFNCQRNGRPDLNYLKYRWQPRACPLQRFNAKDFLQRFKGKSIMFVGDSLSRNQWQSLKCLLYSSVPNARVNETYLGQEDVTTFTFLDYGVKIMLHRSVYLVDVVWEKIGKVLKLDSIQGGKLWMEADMLIFNTWHWWNRRGPTQPWDYIQIGNQVLKDMDRMKAFEIALTTWARWVDSNIDPTKTRVFFQGISPSHYNGTDWGELRATCLGQEQPLLGSTYPGGLPAALAVLKQVLSNIEKPVTLLDITNLSILRKDGHPSIYGLGGVAGMDCSHWCLAGVPDTWNQILYNLITLPQH